jgi:hypothetical protein
MESSNLTATPTLDLWTLTWSAPLGPDLEIQAAPPAPLLFDATDPASHLSALARNSTYGYTALFEQLLYAIHNNILPDNLQRPEVAMLTYIASVEDASQRQELYQLLCNYCNGVINVCRTANPTKRHLLVGMVIYYEGILQKVMDIHRETNIFEDVLEIFHQL